MIAALSPADINYEETLSTLRSDTDVESVDLCLNFFMQPADRSIVRLR